MEGRVETEITGWVWEGVCRISVALHPLVVDPPDASNDTVRVMLGLVVHVNQGKEEIFRESKDICWK